MLVNSDLENLFKEKTAYYQIILVFRKLDHLNQNIININL